MSTGSPIASLTCASTDLKVWRPRHRRKTGGWPMSTRSPTPRSIRRRIPGTWAPTSPASRVSSCPISAASARTGRSATTSPRRAMRDSRWRGPSSGRRLHRSFRHCERIVGWAKRKRAHHRKFRDAAWWWARRKCAFAYPTDLDSFRPPAPLLFAIAAILHAAPVPAMALACVDEVDLAIRRAAFADTPALGIREQILDRQRAGVERQFGSVRRKPFITSDGLAIGYAERSCGLRLANG